MSREITKQSYDVTDETLTVGRLIDLLSRLDKSAAVYVNDTTPPIDLNINRIFQTVRLSNSEKAVYLEIEGLDENDCR